MRRPVNTQQRREERAAGRVAQTKNRHALAGRRSFIDINSTAPGALLTPIGSTDDESAPPAIPARIVPAIELSPHSLPPENWWRRRGLRYRHRYEHSSRTQHNFARAMLGASGIVLP